MKDVGLLGPRVMSSRELVSDIPGTYWSGRLSMFSIDNEPTPVNMSLPKAHRQDHGSPLLVKQNACLQIIPELSLLVRKQQ